MGISGSFHNDCVCSGRAARQCIVLNVDSQQSLTFALELVGAYSHVFISYFIPLFPSSLFDFRENRILLTS